ncbi:MAG TPA: LptF/LptG family permease [Prolixibacteraceae bacterium]|nr:LptF/LptG family permease [Prolixibacteraceae bacterium]
MKRLYSYIIKSFIGPFVLTFFICVFILLMQFLWKYLDDMVGKGLGNDVIIELMSYASLSLVPLALPLAVLLASIMTFGNLGERFELLAIKASGVSLLKIMRPLIFFNIITVLVAFFMADQVIPISNSKFAALLWSVKEQRPEMIIKEGVFSNDMDGYSIKVSSRDPETKALLNLMIYDHTDQKGNVNVTLADSGYLNISDDKQFMILKLYNGESYTDEKAGDRKAKDSNPFRREKFKEQEVVIGVKNYNLKRMDEKYFKDIYKMLSSNQLSSVIDSLKLKYVEKELLLAFGLRYNELLDKQMINYYYPDSINVDSLLALNTCFQLDTLFQSLTKTTRASLLNTTQQIAQQNQRTILQYEPEISNRFVQINKHVVELQKKYSLSLACLMFFFIGAPLGAIIRKGGFGMPVVISILLFITYYLISVIGEKVSREGVWKIDMVLWVPTIFFFIIGIILTHQAVTDSLLLNSETYNRIIRSMNFFRFIPKKRKKHNNENTVFNQ